MELLFVYALLVFILSILIFVIIKIFREAIKQDEEIERLNRQGWIDRENEIERRLQER